MSFPMQAQRLHILTFEPSNAVSSEQQASPGSLAPHTAPVRSPHGSVPSPTSLKWG